jgi:DNA-binding ferritin-like protein
MMDHFASWNVVGYLNLDPDSKRRAEELLTTLLGRLKALFWFHWTAHWQTAGAHYYADHLLYERLKDETYEEIDPVAETAVGYFGEGAVCPFHVMEHEHEGMIKMENLVAAALGQEQGFQALLTSTIEELKALGAMTPGLDDMLPAIAHTHDAHVYLLQQRMGGTKRTAFDGMADRLLAGEEQYSSNEWQEEATRHADEDDPWLAAAGSPWDEWVAAGFLNEER